MFGSFFNSSKICLRRASNSPRYMVPATVNARSSDNNFFPCNTSGTSPAARRFASPSTIAVLPTPGSPRRIGLFFVRRHRISMTRVSSFSRPMTGSSVSAVSGFVSSRVNASSAESRGARCGCCPRCASPCGGWALSASAPSVASSDGNRDVELRT